MKWNLCRLLILSAAVSSSSFMVKSASAVETQNVCVDIQTYPEGDHKNYELQILGQAGNSIKLGDTVIAEISQEFAPAPALQVNIIFISNTNNLLMFKSADNSVSISIDRSKSFGVAPLFYSVNLQVNTAGVVYSSQATPLASDSSQSVALPYTAEMLNPDYPAAAQGRGQLINCGL